MMIIKKVGNHIESFQKCLKQKFSNHLYNFFAFLYVSINGLV